ncbi:glycosyltransferase family 1 protein [Janthinobacterium sp. 17J80-10]|uniref:glycosyltransferase family 4 protein n=1 Tax=Janthinobacterium sp. 17J80-10 TaxID=2497863 RepID=UPI001005530A|nr:glycosyltransferase family 1 protein [Janthinobacterium sp. 17J80-10]QAU35533.1 glycosyltransferase family 1 protein [Janthinobacterium sp. 17J80-10]
MRFTTANNDKLRLLLDLKPALDGYAGIPQESRLLFRGLRSMEGYDVEGLIQHGGRKLRPALSSKTQSLSVAKRINRLSRAVVSLYENPYSNMFDKAVQGVENYYALHLLRLRTLTGRPLPAGIFESEHFDDFIWRTFFSKTLKAADKELVSTARYRVLGTPRKLLHQAGLAGLKFSSEPRYVPIDTTGSDIFLAQTPFPGRVSKGTQMVVRYHDAVPILMPHTINDRAFHQASHFYALQDNVNSGAWFSCISEATRNDLLKIFPQAEARSSVIHNIVSDEYFEEDSSKGLIFQILRNRQGKVDEFKQKSTTLEKNAETGEFPDFEYLLMVSTIEPRKNHLLLTEAWERLKYSSKPNLKLVIVGSLGWEQGPVLNAFRPWAERGELFYLNNVPAAELRVLYRHAEATICPSFAEGFDYTGIEAMLSGGIVISSDIPVHREIYGDASEYFSAYSTEDATQVLGKVLAEDGAALRAQLKANAREVSARYTAEAILPKWNAFFQKLKQAK